MATGSHRFSDTGRQVWRNGQHLHTHGRPALMVRVIYVDGHGMEAAAVELDDFTVRTLHPRIAELLEDAVSTSQGPRPRFKVSKKAHPRHSRTPKRPRG
jgi:hypothetical protein